MRNERWQVNDNDGGLNLEIELENNRSVRLTVFHDDVRNVDLVEWGWIDHSFMDEDRASFREWLDLAMGIDLTGERKARANEPVPW
jgi:hypothetical protein